MQKALDFVSEWFLPQNERWWFDATPEDDAHLTDKYMHLLDLNIDVMTSTRTLTSDAAFAWLVVYDQLPRHAFRGQPAHHVVSFFLQKSIQMISWVDVDALTPREWCFAMLPFRHTNEPAVLQMVARITRNKLDAVCDSPQDVEVVRRFAKALYARFPKEDQSWFISKKRAELWMPEDWEGLLEHCPPRLKPAFFEERHPLAAAVKRELARLDRRGQPVIVSLSGGVDSMVCLHVLHHLHHLHHLKGTIHVVHVNYCNRETANQEERFVCAWAGGQYGYPVHVRKIDEINRPQCMKHDMRAVYESYTRDVRYNTYKTVDPTAAVVMGHNRDDCLENVFQNVAHRAKYDNLYGMSALGTCERSGVTFFRPLLGVDKAGIVEYALEHNIPFLPNSTPEWSMRGQIRNYVVPALDSWCDTFVPGMFALSQAVADLHESVSHSVRAFVRGLKEPQDVAELPTTEIFWRMVLKEIWPPDARTRQCSARSIKNFVDRLKAWKGTRGGAVKMRFDLGNGVSCVLTPAKHQRCLVCFEHNPK